MILIIDDDPDIRAFITNVLIPLEYQLVEAKSMEDGLKIYQEVQPKLVITDIILPGKNGFQVIDEIRRINKEVPIIAMTGNLHGRADAYLSMCKNLGANLVMYKPLTVEKLAASVSALYPAEGERQAER